jgi:hypothetical protein
VSDELVRHKNLGPHGLPAQSSDTQAFGCLSVFLVLIAMVCGWVWWKSTRPLPNPHLLSRIVDTDNSARIYDFRRKKTDRSPGYESWALSFPDHFPIYTREMGEKGRGKNGMKVMSLSSKGVSTTTMAFGPNPYSATLSIVSYYWLREHETARRYDRTKSTSEQPSIEERPIFLSIWSGYMSMANFAGLKTYREHCLVEPTGQPGLFKAVENPASEPLFEGSQTNKCGLSDGRSVMFKLGTPTGSAKEGEVEYTARCNRHPRKNYDYCDVSADHRGWLVRLSSVSRGNIAKMDAIVAEALAFLTRHTVEYGESAPSQEHIPRGL